MRRIAENRSRFEKSAGTCLAEGFPEIRGFRIKPLPEGIQPRRMEVANGHTAALAAEDVAVRVDMHALGPENGPLAVSSD